MVTTVKSVYMYLVWLVLLVGMSGCVTSRSSHDYDIATNSQRLDEQQKVLQEQTEKLSEIALSQHAFAKSIKNMQAYLKQTRQPIQPSKPKKENKNRDAKPLVSATHLMASKAKNAKTVIGRNEWVWIDLLNKTFKARVDTGALSSALDAKNIQPFERNGEKWVRFTLMENENSKQFSRPLVRYVQVRHSSAEALDRRPVISLRVRMGDIVEDTEFTLNNRARMLYPVLLGRNFLRDIVVVDVAKKFTQSKYKPKIQQQ